MVFDAQAGQRVIITVRPFKGERGRIAAVGAGDNHRLHMVSTDDGRLILVNGQDLKTDSEAIGNDKSQGAATPEPDPVKGKREVLPAVIADLHARSEFGRVKYGTVLMTYNGRNSLMDAYQESLDQVMYLKQTLMEQEGQED